MTVRWHDERWREAASGSDVNESERVRSVAAFIWSVADLLRGEYRASEYGKAILPFVILRRLDGISASGMTTLNPEVDLAALAAGPGDLAWRLRSFVAGLPRPWREVLNSLGFDEEIDHLEQADLLHLVVSTFAELDLHPEKFTDAGIGHLYEDLVRRFAELSGDEGGEHFTSRDVVRLVTSLLLAADLDRWKDSELTPTILDPACGTGGFLLR